MYPLAKPGSYIVYVIYILQIAMYVDTLPRPAIVICIIYAGLLHTSYFMNRVDSYKLKCNCKYLILVYTQ